MGRTRELIDVTVPPDSAGTVVSDVLNPLKTKDETGIIYGEIQSSGSPGARLVVQGRASEEAPWATLALIDKTDVDADNYFMAVVQWMPHVRVVSQDQGAAAYRHHCYYIE